MAPELYHNSLNEPGQRIDDGSRSEVRDRESVSLDERQEYEAVVEWHDGTGSESEGEHVIELYELDKNLGRDSLVVSFLRNDNTYTTGEGVEWRHSTNIDSSHLGVIGDRWRYLGDV